MIDLSISDRFRWNYGDAVFNVIESVKLGSERPSLKVGYSRIAEVADLTVLPFIRHTQAP